MTTGIAFSAGCLRIALRRSKPLMSVRQTSSKTRSGDGRVNKAGRIFFRFGRSRFKFFECHVSMKQVAYIWIVIYDEQGKLATFKGGCCQCGRRAKFTQYPCRRRICALRFAFLRLCAIGAAGSACCEFREKKSPGSTVLSSECRRGTARFR